MTHRQCGVRVWAARQGGRDVTLVGAGLDDEPASEDAHVVGLIAQRLSRQGAQLTPTVPALASPDSLYVFTSLESAARLASLGYAEDVRFCAQVHLWDLVSALRDGAFVAQRGRVH